MKGIELKNAIKGKGLTIGEAAEQIGISRQSLHYALNKAELDAEFLQNVSTKLKIEVGPIKIDQSQAEFMGNVKEELTALKAAVKILTLKIVGLESKSTKKPFDKVSLELGEMIDKEAERLLGVLRGKS